MKVTVVPACLMVSSSTPRNAEEVEYDVVESRQLAAVDRHRHVDEVESVHVTPPTASAPVGPLVTTGGWAGALVIRLPLTTTGRRFNISRAPAPTCKSPWTVNGSNEGDVRVDPIEDVGESPAGMRVRSGQARPTAHR